MQFCDHHWQMLREEIRKRGLYDLVASSGQEVALRMTQGGFDPLMGAHNVILSALARVAGPGILMIEGCPVCEGNKAHDEGCQDPTCRPNWYDAWLPELAPSTELVKLAQSASSDKEWAAFVKRYRAEMCPDCADQTCPDCRTHLRDIEAFDQMAGRMLQAAQAAPAATASRPGPDRRAQPAADREAGQ